MANTHDTLTELFADIASAIRSKTGSTANIVADNFPTAISNITPKLQSKSVTPTTSSQIIKPDSGYDGLSQVTVGVGGLVGTWEEITDSTTVKRFVFDKNVKGNQILLFATYPSTGLFKMEIDATGAPKSYTVTTYNTTPKWITQATTSPGGNSGGFADYTWTNNSTIKFTIKSDMTGTYSYSTYSTPMSGIFCSY